MSLDTSFADTQLADPLSMAAARLALDTALQHAGKHGWRVSVAVLDAGGHLLAFGRSAGAPLHTIDLAQDKALTAVNSCFCFGIKIRTELCKARQFAELRQRKSQIATDRLNCFGLSRATNTRHR